MGGLSPRRPSAGFGPPPYPNPRRALDDLEALEPGSDPFMSRSEMGVKRADGDQRRETYVLGPVLGKKLASRSQHEAVPHLVAGCTRGTRSPRR